MPPESSVFPVPTSPRWPMAQAADRQWYPEPSRLRHLQQRSWWSYGLRLQSHLRWRWGLRRAGRREPRRWYLWLNFSFLLSQLFRRCLLRYAYKDQYIQSGMDSKGLECGNEVFEWEPTLMPQLGSSWTQALRELQLHHLQDLAMFRR